MSLLFDNNTVKIAGNAVKEISTYSLRAGIN